MYRDNVILLGELLAFFFIFIDDRDVIIIVKGYLREFLPDAAPPIIKRYILFLRDYPYWRGTY